MNSLFTSVAWPKARSPKRADVLDTLAAVIPWERIEAIVFPLLPPPAATGRKPTPLRVMVRAFILQWLFQLSDDATESTIMDSHAAARFCALDPWRPRPPGATAIRKFRHAIMTSEAAEAAMAWLEISHLVNRALSSSGLTLIRGTIVEPQLRRVTKSCAG